MDRTPLVQRPPTRAGARRLIGRAWIPLLHGVCVSLLILPPFRVGAAPPSSAPPQTLAPAGAGDPAVAALQAEFAAEAESLGLHALGGPEVERIGSDLIAVRTIAAVPLDQRTTPVFFLQRTLVVSRRADLPSEVLARTDFSVRYAGDHVTLEYSDRFSAALDAFAGRITGLGGSEIRRTAEFDSPGLEAYAAARLREALAGDGGGSASLQSQASVPIQADNYVARTTIVGPDGSERQFSSGQLEGAAVLSGLGSGGDLTISCLTDCFNATGGTINLVTAACLVGSLVVCVAVCALTAAIGCLPCIGGAGTVCGLTIAAVSLGVCIARCINPDFTPPPDTPTPTPTPPPCVGDCNGDGAVSVNELVRGVSVLLGALPIDACRALDADGNGMISIGELIAAVRKALGGCGAP